MNKSGKYIIPLLIILLYTCHFDSSTNNEFFTSIKVKDYETIKQLLKKGEDINQQSKNKKVTGLHLALLQYNENLDFIKFLLKNGANPEIKDIDGNTTLHYAAITPLNNGVIAVNLIRHNANVNTKNNSGATPWDFLWSQPGKFDGDQIKFLEILLRKQYPLSPDDIDKKTGKNWLHKVAERCPSKYIVDIMIKNLGFDINAKDKNGWTALHHAMMNNNIMVVNALLENNAKYNEELDKQFRKKH